MKYIVANWKAYFNLTQTHEWARTFSSLPLDVFIDKVTFIVCPPFPFIHVINELLYHPSVKIGAQDVSRFPEGPYTGEVTAQSLSGMVDYVIVGHSERRIHLKEDDKIIEEKCVMACSQGITPIVCVRNTADKIPDNVTFIAYEPVEAIGSGKNASLQEVLEIRKQLHISASHQFFYGGSVKADNAKDYLFPDEIQGVILGGASLEPKELFAIGKVAASHLRQS